VQADIGSYSQRDLKTSVATASGDGEWRMRVAYATLHHDGFGHNLVGGEPVSNQNTNAGRASFGYFPHGVPLTVQLSMDATHDNSNERGFQRLAANKFDAAKTPLSNSRYDISSGMPDVNWTHGDGAALNVTYGLSDAWTVKLIAAHRKSDTQTTIDFDGVKQAIADVNGDYHDRQNTQELQAVYEGDAASGVIGLYHFDGSAGGHIFNNFLNLQFANTASTVFTKSKALYADWNVKLIPRWELGAGLRYTDEEKHAVVDNLVFKDGSFTTPIAVAANFDRKLATSKLSPKLSLKFDATDSTNLYASAARGFKSGGFNIRANTAAVPASSKPYLDEEVTTYEVGSKSNFDGGRLQLNLAAFHSNYRNMQLSVFTSYTLANGTQGFFGDFTNAGKATINGLEIESIWKPTANWSVSGHLSNLHTRYDEYIDKGVNVASQKWFSNAPKVQAGLNLQYNTRVAFGGTLTARLGYTYQSKVYPTTDLSEDIAQDAYGLVGAGLIWDRDRNWSFALQGANLADKRYRTDGYNIAALGILSGYYGPPRMITASATYRF
jgi:iron complex outermembrane receptor protein